MTTFLKDRSTLIFVLLLLAMLILTWLFPSSRFLIEAAFLLVSLALASLVVVGKNRESYKQGKLTRGAFVGHSLFDVFSVLLAMAATGWLAHSVAQILMAQAGSDVRTLAAVLAASLLAGVSIGMLMKRIRRQVLSPSNQ